MALRDINLLPESLLQRRLLVRHALLWAVAYGLAVTILVTGYLFYTRTAIPQTKGPVNEEQARKQLALTITEINGKNEEIERLEFVRHVSFSIGTSEILGQLASVLDAKTWLTKISLIDNQDETYLLTMKGLSYSNAKLGNTLRVLTADPYFEDVILRDTVDVNPSTASQDMPKSIVQFTMDAKVKAR